VTPLFMGNQDILAFAYVNPDGTPLTVAVNSPGQEFVLDLTYQAEAINSSSLTAVQIASMFGNSSPGTASATLYAQPTSGGTISSSSVFDGGISNPQAIYDGPTTAINGGNADPFNIQDSVTLEAESGSSSDSGFINFFSELLL